MSTKPKTRRLFVVINISFRTGNRIQKEKNPTFLYTEIKSAKAEARRLSTENVGQRFGVFRCECVASATQPQPIISGLTADDLPTDEIPF